MQTDASLILCSYDNVTVKTCSHFCWFQEHCRTLNADLVSIHDDKELLSALCLTWRINHERHTIWIGARRSEVNCECLRELNHGWMEDYVCYPSSLILTFLFFRESLNGLMDPHLRIICGILVNQTTLMEKRTASSPTIAVSQKNKKSSKKGFSFKNGWRPKINDWIRKKSLILKYLKFEPVALVFFVISTKFHQRSNTVEPVTGVKTLVWLEDYMPWLELIWSLKLL